MTRPTPLRLTAAALVLLAAPAVATAARAKAMPAEAEQQEAVARVAKLGLPVYEAGRQGKYVALTFDDGPGPDTPAVLAELKKLDVPATFFVIGRNVKENPQVLNQVVAAGHEIGVHTWNHPDLTTLTPKEQESEIASTAGEIVAVTGMASRLFRAPYGSVNPAVLKRAEDAKLLSVLWDVDTVDWTRPSTEQIVQTAVANAGPGSIILMHDGGGNRASTVAAIPKIVSQLRAKGYEFATVGDLVISDPPGSDDMSSDSRSTQQ